MGGMAGESQQVIRGRERSAAILFRMSPEERRQLQEEAIAGGFLTVHQLLEFRVFGECRPVRPSSRTLTRNQEERLDISA